MRTIFGTRRVDQPGSPMICLRLAPARTGASPLGNQGGSPSTVRTLLELNTVSPRIETLTTPVATDGHRCPLWARSGKNALNRRAVHSSDSTARWPTVGGSGRRKI